MNAPSPSPPPRRRRWIHLITLGLLVAGFLGWRHLTAPPAPPAVPADAIDPAVTEAVQTARDAVVASPRSAQAWGHLGMVLRAHDFVPQAIAAFSQAERLDPREGRWPYLLGLTVVLADPPAGIACLRRAVDRLPDEPAPRCRLAEILLEQGLLDDAAQILQPLPPNHPRGRLLRARLQVARQNWKAALPLAESLFNDPSARGRAYQLAIECQRRLGQDQQADTLLTVARRLPPDQLWFDPLVVEVERLRVGFLAALAQIYRLEREGHTAQAIAELRRTLTRYPDQARGWLILGRLLRSVQQLPEAENALNRAVSLDPDLVEGWFTLGVVRLLRDQSQPAAEAFATVLRLKPDYSMAHYNLGVARLQLKDVEGARQAWLQTLLCDPDNTLATEALARLPRKP